MLINGSNYYFVNKEKDICVENIEDALSAFKCPSMCIDCNLGPDKCNINYVNNYPIECARLMEYKIIAEKDLPEKYLSEKDLSEYPVAKNHSERVSQILTKILEAGDKAVTAKEIAEDYNKNYNGNCSGVNIQNIQNNNPDIPKICQILNIEPYAKFNINIRTVQHPSYSSNFYWFDDKGKLHQDIELKNKEVDYKLMFNTMNYLLETKYDNIIRIVEEKEEENILTS